jgi:hypothetical protein
VSAVTEARTGLDASLIGKGIQSGQLVIGSLNDPIWQPLPAESANPVKVARRYVASLLAEIAKIDSDPPRAFRTVAPLRLGRLERKMVVAESQELLS